MGARASTEARVGHVCAERGQVPQTRIAIGLAMTLLLEGVAFATDLLHEASLLSLRSSPVRQKVRFVARVPPVRSPSADPMRVGAILEVVNPISGEAATFDLPPAGWSTLAATGFYRFVNPAAPAGIPRVTVGVSRSGPSNPRGAQGKA